MSEKEYPYRPHALFLFVSAVASIVVVSSFGHALSWSWITPEEEGGSESPAPISRAKLWLYTFNTPGILEEAPREEESVHPYLWLSSGGELISAEGAGHTLRGALLEGSLWRAQYAAHNSLDTDGGRYPQNIFRLITKSAVRDTRASIFFKIDELHTTQTSNRGEWSGVFLMTRFYDSDNLYYAGVRQDGHAVIKKKISGTYYTLAEVPVFTGTGPYAPDTNPNVLPEKTWLGLRTETKNVSRGVLIELSVSVDEGASWTRVLSALDTGVGGPLHEQSGRVGVRGDYMDLSFENFLIEAL